MGVGGAEGRGSLRKRCPPGTAARLPAACRECLGRPHLTRQRRAKGLTASPLLFPPRSVNSKGPGRQGAPGSASWHGLALPAPVPGGKTTQLKAEPSWWGAASSARHSPRRWDLGDRSGDAALPHCGTTRGLSRDVPDPRLQPRLSGSSAPGGGEGGRRHGAGGAFPHPTFAKRPDDLV